VSPTFAFGGAGKRIESGNSNCVNAPKFEPKMESWMPPVAGTRFGLMSMSCGLSNVKRTALLIVESLFHAISGEGCQ
jgi:hypothetical protein